MVPCLYPGSTSLPKLRACVNAPPSTARREPWGNPLRMPRSFHELHSLTSHFPSPRSLRLLLAVAWGILTAAELTPDSARASDAFGGITGSGRWETRASTDATNTFHAVAFGGGRFLAVGDRGLMATSTNGTAWRVLATGERQTLHGVAYSPTLDGVGAFVAVGAPGNYLTDPPPGASNKVIVYNGGESWVTWPLATPHTLRGIAFGQGRFIAVGDGDTVLMSVVPSKWFPRAATGAGNLRGVAFGLDLFVAVGERGARTSNDAGVTWTSSLDGQDLTSVGYALGRFVAWAGNRQRWFSTDGLHWTEIGGDSTKLRAITAWEGTLLGVGGEGAAWMANSPEGLSWTENPLDLSRPTDELLATASGGGRVVAIGRSGTVLSRRGSEAWQMTTLAGPEIFARITFGAGTFVAATMSGVLTSTNGVIWERHVPANGGAVADVAFAEGRFVATGLNLDSRYQIWSSTNGRDWEPRLTGAPAQRLLGVAHGNGRWVVVGNWLGHLGVLPAIAWFSSDGVTWTESTFDTEPGVTVLNQVTFGSGFFLASAAGATWRRSVDGTRWETIQASGLSGTIMDLGFSEGRFVAYNENQTVFGSPDGISWQELSAGPTSTFHPVLQLPDGFASFGLHGEIWHSRDRLVWRETKLDSINGIVTDIAYGNGALVGIEAGWRGTFGRILQTGGLERLPVAIASARSLPDGRPRVIATGPVGTEQLLESAAELGHWSFSNRLTNVTGVVTFTDRQLLPGENRFYRTLTPAR